MFNKLYIVVAESEKDVCQLVRLATNNHLYVSYKIGVYGDERQHELFIIGKPWHYYKFKNAIKKSIATIEKKGGAQ